MWILSQTESWFQILNSLALGAFLGKLISLGHSISPLKHLLSYQTIGEIIDATGKARLFIATLGRIDSLAREGEGFCGRLVDIVSCDLTLHTG